ncbi:hypothetical protein BH09VER1_BH09VER1_41610 [soil metagenome]
MSAELIIFLVALLVTLGCAGIGWLFGGAGVIRYLLASLFAVLLAVRYWYPATEAIGPGVSMNPLFVAGGIFACLFIIALAVAGMAVRFNAPRFQSVLSDPVDKTLGVVFGLAMGILLGGALLLDLSFFTAGFTGEFDSARFPVRLDRAPIAVFAVIESSVAGVPAESKTVRPVIKADPAANAAQVILAWE